MSNERPCDVCHQRVGNPVFTICDNCWPTHGPAASTPTAPQPETEGMTEIDDLLERIWSLTEPDIVPASQSWRRLQAIREILAAAKNGGRS